MNKKVHEIMAKNIVWIDGAEPLYKAYELMRKFDIRHIPVTSKKVTGLIGILSEGDIILHCQKNGENFKIDKAILVQDAMSKDIVYCYPFSRLVNIAATMIAAKIDSIPVLDPESKVLRGIVTTVDILDEVCRVEEMNGGIARPLRYKKSIQKERLRVF